MKFWPFKKKAAPALAVPAAAPTMTRQGFFGTDFFPNAMPEAARVQLALMKTFQRGIESLKPVDAQGYAVDGAQHAMDDAYPNLTEAKLRAQTGGWLPIPQLEWYAGQGFIGWQTCAILAQNWLVDKACSMPGRDAVRHGWELTIDDGEDKVKPDTFDKLKRLDKRFKIKQNCMQFIKMGRIFGIRHALFLVDGINYELPFNPDGVRPGSYRGITQIDPYWISPLLDASAAGNPAAPDFYDPTWWLVNGKRVHKSHFVIMRNGDEVPDILKPSYLYGGIPTPQKIYERVYAAERTANEAPMLAMTKRLTSLKIDLTQAMTDEVKLQQKMEFWSQLMNNYGIKVIGESEEIEQFDTSLNDLDAVIMTQFQLVAAASDIPATKLMGTTPKGFNATGEYDAKSYHEYLESIQENELTPLLDRHYLLLSRSCGDQVGIKGKHIDHAWNPVDSPDALEQADINLKKSQVDTALVTAGAIDGFDVRQRIINDKDSGYTGIEDIVPDGPGDRDAEQEQKELENELLMQGAQGAGGNAKDDEKASNEA